MAYKGKRTISENTYYHVIKEVSDLRSYNKKKEVQ